MAQVTNIETFNWRKLESAIEQITTAINSNMPIEGDGIRIVDGNGIGKIISLSASGSAAADGQNVGGGMANLQGTQTLTWQGVKWETLTVVDPSTCAQIGVTVLVRSDNIGDSVQIQVKELVAVFPPASQ